jgi:hypothetical protein
MVGALVGRDRFLGCVKDRGDTVSHAQLVCQDRVAVCSREAAPRGAACATG